MSHKRGSRDAAHECSYITAMKSNKLLACLFMGNWTLHHVAVFITRSASATVDRLHVIRESAQYT